jgi:hypothetical protein
VTRKSPESRPPSPAQWLDELQQNGFSWLLDRHGGDVIGAGYELACVKNMSSRYVSPTPTRAEVCAAVRQITGDSTYTLDAISLHCRVLGLVILD